MLASLVGCQPVPHPFAEEGSAANPLLHVPESHGVVLGPIVGLTPERDGEIRHRLANALQNEGVLASTRRGNGNSYWLSAVAEGALLDWQLQSPEGDVVHRLEDVGLLESVSPGFARDVAEALRSALPESQKSLPAGSQADAPVLVLAGVEGAPGDGSVALARALNAALAIRGIRLVRDGPAPLMVRGVVAVEPVRAGVERVNLVWSVLSAEGEELGNVKQSNEVPAGSLGGRWGSIAEAAAQGAADGILGVLDGLHAQSLGSG